MVRHVWSVLCAKSSIDKETNNVSLFEVLEQLTVNVGKEDVAKAKEAAVTEGFGVPVDFEIVTLLDREVIKGKLGSALTAEIIDPSGKQLRSFSHAFEFTEGKRRMRVQIRAKGFPVTASGMYRLVIRLTEGAEKKGRVVADIPLEVIIAYGT